MPDYAAPPFWDREGNEVPQDRKLGWIREAIEQGTSFLKTQNSFDKLDRAFDIINGKHISDAPNTLSNVKTNRTKRQVKEIVASLSNLRIVPAYSTDVREYYEQAVILNKTFMGWWHETKADRPVRAALQYAVPTGTGYISPRWDPDFHVPGRGDVALDVYGPRDVLPVQLPRNHDLQKAYAVTLRVPTPLALAHRTYPLFQDQIIASRQAASGMRRATSAAASFLSPVLSVFGQGRKKEDSNAPWPEVDIYKIYIDDRTINNTGRPILMGDPGTTWEYTVPFVGQETPVGRDSNGNTIYRKAGPEDCLLYPLRRLIVATDTCVIYDGTAKDWHGKVPLIPFRGEDWAWQFLGYPLTDTNASIEQSNVGIYRQIYDLMRARLGVPVGYDKQAIPKAVADAIDPRFPNQKVGLDLNLANVEQLFKPLYPPGYYDIPAVIPEFLNKMEERGDFEMGVRDMMALAQARQLPASDSLDRLMEIIGPLVQDISRGMETSICTLGGMMKSMFFQWYTLARRMQMLGSDGKAEQDFDLEPGSMVPAHMPGEEPDKPSSVPAWQRRKWHQNNFTFKLTPYSLHQITQTTRKLILLQLQKAGFPMDPWTIAEAFDLNQFGPPPDDATTGMQRWLAWTHMQRELQQEFQAGMAAAAPQPGPGQGKGGGRPNAYTAPPTIQLKDGGTRATIRTSPK